MGKDRRSSKKIYDRFQVSQLPRSMTTHHSNSSLTNDFAFSGLYLRPQKGELKSPIFSPDPESKPAISIPYYSTPIPRGIHRDRERPDKPITHRSRKNKPVILPRQEEPLDKKFL